MHQPDKKTLLEMEMWGDLASCSAALLFASGMVTRPFWRKDVLMVEHPLRQLVLLIALVCGWRLSLALAGLYRSFRLASRAEFALSMFTGISLATICTALWLWLHVLAAGEGVGWGRQMFGEVLLFAVAFACILSASRVGSHIVTRWLRARGRNLRYVLIVGTNQRAIRTAEALTSDRSRGYRLVGFVDDYWHASQVPEAYRSMLVGPLANLPGLLRTLALDEVVVALPIASAYAQIQSVLHECSQQGILVRCEASLFDAAATGSPARDVPLHFVMLHESTWGRWGVLAKNVIDFSVALCALCVLSPVLLCVAAAIKVTSPGPVFFLQERLGVGKRRFKIYKFRTMVINAEKLMASVEHLNQTQGPTFKLTNDPRITPVGKFLRKTSLDELPQFINVLLGDMSLVGPRPLPLRDYNGFSEDWHRRRFSVKPGLTCLWQIMGRSSIGFDRWMELDMNYIDTWSVWLDIKILVRTIPAVLRGSGAA